MTPPRINLFGLVATHRIGRSTDRFGATYEVTLAQTTYVATDYGDAWKVLFWDMHSGGGLKVHPFSKIYVEASSEDEARAAFERMFSRDPDHVTCSCCGSDYSVSEYSDLEQATAYHRHCGWDHATGKYSATERDPHRAKYFPSEQIVSVAEYCQAPDVRIVPRTEWEVPS